MLQKWRQLAIVVLLATVGRVASEPIVDVETPAWRESDPVEVFFAELLISSWVLDHAPWNVYHSGLAFLNNATGAKCMFDYVPFDTSSVSRMLVPEIVGTGLAPEVRWNNEAQSQFHNHWPKDFKGFVRLGFTNGSVFHRFFKWVQEDFARKHNTFDPVEVVFRRADASEEEAPNPEGSLSSNMCHDFVVEALWKLHSLGVHLHAESDIFRDHIIMFGKAINVSSDIADNGRRARERYRYLRALHLFLERIKDQFTYGRDALIATWKMGIPAFVHVRNEDFLVELTPPFLNYCYLPVVMPPQVVNPFAATKLCALPMEANITNVTVPWPWGSLLAAEQGLDRSEVFMTLGAVGSLALACILAAALAPSMWNQTSQRQQSKSEPSHGNS